MMTDILMPGGAGLTRRQGRPQKKKTSRLRRRKSVRASSEVATSSKITYPTNDKCLIVQDFEKDVEDLSKCFCEVQDEFIAPESSCCLASTPDSGFHDDTDSSPLTKLNFKPETDEIVSKVAAKLTGTREVDKKNAKSLFKSKSGRNKKSFQDSIKNDVPSDQLKTEIIKCSAEIGFSQCSKKYGISVDTIKGYIQSWINPSTEEPKTVSNVLHGSESNPFEQQFDGKNPDVAKKTSSPVKRPRGRPPKNARSNSDMSELPLSHVKLIRKKLVKSIKIDKKKDKCKQILLKQKLNGTVKLKSQKEKIKRRLLAGQKKKKPLVKTKADELKLEKSTPMIVKPEPLEPVLLSSSVTVFDADVARPSRPIHRPVRYLDSLNQNAENFAVKKLNIVDKFDLPYDKDSLVWNKHHSKNKQNVYCYCGGGGSWHCKMVTCVRCRQWFHERCLAPRPYNMPIVPGDTAWLFVCSLCNSGSECLKRMDMAWADVVHLAMFDLTVKTMRRHHDYDKDIMPHLLDNWDRLQLYKHHAGLSEDEKRMRTKEALLTEKERFESGSESRQDLNLWALRRPVPPPRPVYNVPDIGIVSERTVLNEFSVSATISHERTDTFIEGSLVKIYKDYDKEQKKSSQARKTDMNSTVEKCEHKVENVKTKKCSNKSSLSSPQISNQEHNKLLKKTAKVEFKPLKLPKEILSVTKKSVSKASPTKKLPAKKNVKEDAKAIAPKLPPKPLPYEIARMLHKKGYPKVAMKFASIIPPKREAIQLESVEDTDNSKEGKSKKKKAKKEVSIADSDNASQTQNGISAALKSQNLDSLIPEKPNFLGDNNPFHLGSAEETRAARNFLCNRKLKEEDLTKCRSKIKKRKYRLNFELARKMWKKESSSLVKNSNKTSRRQLSVNESKRKMQYAGKFTDLSGQTKMIMLGSESQLSDFSNDVEL